ncbi:MAG: hypothetical protein CSA58_02175 [Micrococcales bacterium]|nr:MAG: hypothetical protein CSB46_00545 [Micrococcales bacterium]PIE27835.1 MAG: hypothetical protein CSA58_02175 [Micrococcales bacterium]
MSTDDEHVDYVDDEVRRVRPYLLTRGRTEVSSKTLPVEALVEALAEPDVSLSTDHRGILELTRSEYLSVAEISAHRKIPINVARLLLTDLADQGRIRVHGISTTTSDSGSEQDSVATLSVLESVLNGISSL